jgi:sulfite reductase (ferredoxin)
MRAAYAEAQVIHTDWVQTWKADERALHLQAAQAYEELYHLYLRGQLDEAGFKRRRAYYGVGSRQSPGRVQVRLKALLGRLSVAQLRSAADLAGRYTPRRAFHLTPRQNLNYYDVPLEDSPAFLRAAAEVGFGVAGAGGRAPANVTLPAGTGLLPGEAFDATYAAAMLQRRFDRDEALRSLPGTFKVGFWRSLHDDESDSGNDLTVIPVRRLVGTRLRRGFRLLLGGGLGPRARVEALWKGFVAPQDLYAQVRSVALHFKVRSHGPKPFNRLRHLLAEEGWPAFQHEVSLLAEQQPHDRAALFFHRLPYGKAGASADGLPEWLHGFALPLADAGSYLVKGQPLAGMVSAVTAQGLAELVERYGRDELRITTRQQVWLPWVQEPNLLAAYQELQRLDLAGPFLGTFSACPGLGVCHNAAVGTPGLAREALNALKEGLGSQMSRATAGLQLGASACPNGCGRHRDSDIGFEGFNRPDGHQGKQAWVKVYGRPPGSPDLAEALGSVPVERLPALLLALVEDYQNSDATDLASYLRLPEGFASLQKAVRGLGKDSAP